MFAHLAKLIESLKQSLDEGVDPNEEDIQPSSYPQFHLRLTPWTLGTNPTTWACRLTVKLFGEDYQLEFSPTNKNRRSSSQDLVGSGVDAQEALLDFFSKFAYLATQDIVRVSHTTKQHTDSVSIDVEWKEPWIHRVTNVYH